MPVPLVYVELIWNRTKWQDERKKNGDVPKGAAKVRMGDALDKFHKAAAKGLKEGRAAAEDLKKAIAVYKAAITTKYSKFHDRIQKSLESNVNSYLTESKKIVDSVPDYTKLRELASTEVLIAGAEFQHWEKAGSQGTFKPSNSKKLLEALTTFLTVANKMTFYTDKITKNAATLYDRTVYAASSGTWNKPIIEGLVKQLKEFPNAI